MAIEVKNETIEKNDNKNLVKKNVNMKEELNDKSNKRQKLKKTYNDKQDQNQQNHNNNDDDDDDDDEGMKKEEEEEEGNGFKSLKSLIENSKSFKTDYENSKPFKHSIVHEIFDDRILRSSRSEIKSFLSFSLKETDIYKVFQTGDLANLDGLSSKESEALRNVKIVRDSLYSKTFRDFLNSVTSCGPLSGKQTDMSINDYRSGCHLLNHDDVIGTRRVSYILYLTDPDSKWTHNDGGSLELYPVDPETNHPLNVPSSKIIPSWNQLVFFVVQPGKSFHSVEEVLNPKKSRLSISGWFHLPLEDEEGYEEGQRIKAEEEKKLKSLGASLEQLKGGFNEYDFTPITKDPKNSSSSSSSSSSSIMKDDLKLSIEDFEHLKNYIDPIFLNEKNLSKLKDRFIEDSHLSLSEFLEFEFSNRLKRLISLKEVQDFKKINYYQEEEEEEENNNNNNNNLIEEEKVEENGSEGFRYPEGFSGPRFEFGLLDDDDDERAWEVLGPPHRQRYLTARGVEGSSSNLKEDRRISKDSLSMILELKNLFSSPEFLKWLRILTTFEILGHDVKPRRFRPGLDYSLATSNQDRLLELNLSLTPSLGWTDGEIGGWDCYMTSVDEDQADPAIYKSSSSKKKKFKDSDNQNQEEEEEDSTLLTIYPNWNQLEIVLRDQDVLTFTKYVSHKSNYHSKWDIKGVYKVDSD